MEIKEIHNQFHSLIYNYIAVRVNNRDDTADIFQEVFIKIATKLDSLSDEEKLKSWILAITRNAIIDYYRKNADSKETELTEKIIKVTKAETDSETSHGLDKCLKEFIQQLPKEYRDIIIDSEISGIKQKDLVQKYNLAYPSVRSRVQRGRSRLKEMLLKCCKIELDNHGNVLTAVPQNLSENNCSSCD